MRLFIVGLILTGIAAAQSPAPASEPSKNARIEGAVVSASGGPVKGANLRVFGGALPAAQRLTGVTTVADDMGKFILDQIPPGANYFLLATRAGYVNASSILRPDGTVALSVSLKEGEIAKGLTIMMTPQGVISGRVIDRDGDPVSRASLAALRSEYQHGVRVLTTVTTTTADDKGEYRLANLTAGRYYLVARDNSGGIDIENLLENGTMEKKGAQVVNLATYYPNAPDSEGASLVEATPGGDLRGVDIRMRSSRTFSVLGRAVNSTTGAALGGVILRAGSKPSNPAAPADPLNQLPRYIGRTAADGTFEVRLTPGEWTFAGIGGVSSGSTMPSMLFSDATISVHAQDVSAVVLPMDNGVSISGSLRVEGGDIKRTIAEAAKSGLDAAQSALAAAGLGNQLAGRPLIALYDTSGTLQQSVQANEDGTFKMPLGVAPGKYRVGLIRVPAAFYVKSVHVGAADVSHSVLDFPPGGAGGIDILLSDKPAEIAGRLLIAKDQPRVNVTVALWNKEIELVSTTNGVRTGRFNSDGSFDFTGLPSGEYYVAAWEGGDPELLQNRDLLAMFENDAVKVTVGEGAKRTAETKLITSDRLAAAVAKLP